MAFFGLLDFGNEAFKFSLGSYCLWPRRILTLTIIIEGGCYSDLSMITLMYVVGHVVRSKKLVDEASLLPECGGADVGLSLQCHYR